ncbi:hypothetical protein CEXT_354101 [Caerostris extrusa]|uniref:Uncharacterized protein n=1 Tax=Caerostris extrusa TaxID=172846 RepID=A0AAV4PTI3_CAEEX|nr:hypothetical protein CEXT_354101 [Caerostris extrusa]
MYSPFPLQKEQYGDKELCLLPRCRQTCVVVIPIYYNIRINRYRYENYSSPMKSPSTCFGIIPTNKVTLVFSFVSGFGIILLDLAMGATTQAADHRTRSSLAFQTKHRSWMTN